MRKSNIHIVVATFVRRLPYLLRHPMRATGWRGILKPHVSVSLSATLARLMLVGVSLLSACTTMPSPESNNQTEIRAQIAYCSRYALRYPDRAAANNRCLAYYGIRFERGRYYVYAPSNVPPPPPVAQALPAPRPYYAPAPPVSAPVYTPAPVAQESPPPAPSAPSLSQESQDAPSSSTLAQESPEPSPSSMPETPPDTSQPSTDSKEDSDEGTKIVLGVLGLLVGAAAENAYLEEADATHDCVRKAIAHGLVDTINGGLIEAGVEAFFDNDQSSDSQTKAEMETVTEVLVSASLDGEGAAGLLKEASMEAIEAQFPNNKFAVAFAGNAATYYAECKYEESESGDTN